MENRKEEEVTIHEGKNRDSSCHNSDLCTGQFCAIIHRPVSSEVREGQFLGVARKGDLGAMAWRGTA